MFNLKEFITKNIVNGIKNGTFSKEYGNIMAVNYLVKGILTEEDVASIDTQITAWEAELIAKEEVEEIPSEEVTEPTEDAGEITETSEDEIKMETEQNGPEVIETEPENTEIETDPEETEPVE